MKIVPGSPVPKEVSSMRRIAPLFTLLAALVLLSACADHDVILRGGTIYDGSGSAPFIADLAIDDGRISAIGSLEDELGRKDIDASGMAISPGFINMLSWATESLIEDGRAMSDILQGVTLEIMGEGNSMGPLSEAMKAEILRQQGDITYDIEWTTLGEYLEYLVDRGVSVNVASFLGTATPRVYVLGNADRAPDEDELEQMRELTREAMEEGAMGVSSALIYAPGFYAKTPELIALAEVASGYDGMYISHLRSEGNALLEAFGEFLTITRTAVIRSEIYHLKAGGQANWPKMDLLINEVESARAEGLEVTADMYTYTAGATGLDAAMPPWVQEGGLDDWIARLKDPEIRRQVISEMTTPTTEWENLYLAAGSAENLLLVGFRNDDLKHHTGSTLAEVAAEFGISPEETAIRLVIEDESRVGTVYFLMTEENIRKQIALPWVSFCSDAGAPATEGAFLESNPHCSDDTSGRKASLRSKRQSANSPPCPHTISGSRIVAGSRSGTSPT